MTEPHDDAADDAAWDDPDRAVQIEDDSPESLAGVEVEFDPEADDESDEGYHESGPAQEDFPSDPPSSGGAAANSPADEAP